MTLAAELKGAKSAVRCALQYFKSMTIQMQGMMGKTDLPLCQKISRWGFMSVMEAGEVLPQCLVPI